MKLRVPDYYYDFKCIGGDCTDSCCIGWELDIDEESYEAYKKVEGSFGDRLRESMVDGSDEEDECNTFRLKGGRCPFLNDKNLCDIYINLGEKSLCKVCTEYPRFTVEYENTREKSMALSCEVVGRLLFSREDEIKFIQKEIPDESMAQEVINEGGEDDDLLGMIAALKPGCNNEGKASFNTFFEEVCYLLDELYVLGEEWTEVFARFKSELNKEVLEEFEECRKENKMLDIWYENLMVYFVFRYFTKGVYDCDVISRAKFAFLGFFSIRGIAALRYRDNLKFDIDDMIVSAKAYSKEVEHSEGNIAYLMEEFLFSEEFEIANLQAVIQRRYEA